MYFFFNFYNPKLIHFLFYFRFVLWPYTTGKSSLWFPKRYWNVKNVCLTYQKNTSIGWKPLDLNIKMCVSKWNSNAHKNYLSKLVNRTSLLHRFKQRVDYSILSYLICWKLKYLSIIHIACNQYTTTCVLHILYTTHGW